MFKACCSVVSCLVDPSFTSHVPPKSLRCGGDKSFSRSLTCVWSEQCDLNPPLFSQPSLPPSFLPSLTFVYSVLVMPTDSFNQAFLQWHKNKTSGLRLLMSGTIAVTQSLHWSLLIDGTKKLKQPCHVWIACTKTLGTSDPAWPLK